MSDHTSSSVGASSYCDGPLVCVEIIGLNERILGRALAVGFFRGFEEVLMHCPRLYLFSVES